MLKGAISEILLYYQENSLEVWHYQADFFAQRLTELLICSHCGIQISYLIVVSTVFVEEHHLCKWVRESPCPECQGSFQKSHSWASHPGFMAHAHQLVQIFSKNWFQLILKTDFSLVKLGFLPNCSKFFLLLVPLCRLKSTWNHVLGLVCIYQSPLVPKVALCSVMCLAFSMCLPFSVVRKKEFFLSEWHPLALKIYRADTANTPWICKWTNLSLCWEKPITETSSLENSQMYGCRWSWFCLTTGTILQERQPN